MGTGRVLLRPTNCNLVKALSRQDAAPMLPEQAENPLFLGRNSTGQLVHADTLQIEVVVSMVVCDSRPFYATNVFCWGGGGSYGKATLNPETLHSEPETLKP